MIKNLGKSVKSVTGSLRMSRSMSVPPLTFLGYVRSHVLVAEVPLATLHRQHDAVLQVINLAAQL